MQKDTFKILLAGFAILMIVLPVFAALNAFMTESLDKAGWYRPIQKYLVPWQARMVAAAIAPFGVVSKVTPGSSLSAFYMIKDGAAIPVDLSWNCLGWQSFLLFFASLLFGFRGDYTFHSKVEAFVFGLSGTFLVNIVRLVFTAALVGWWRGLFMILFHNYFFTFTAIVWLFVFWWFVYRYVLEERRQGIVNS